MITIELLEKSLELMLLEVNSDFLKSIGKLLDIHCSSVMKIEIFENFKWGLAFVEKLRGFLPDFLENNRLKLFKSFVANLALKP